VRTSPLAALLALALALPSAARAQGASKSDEASQRFKSGVSFYKDKDYAAALVEFKRAYELVPNYAVLYNLGQTARELRDYAAALAAFERYLRDGGPRISAVRRKEVATALDELRRKVGRVKIVTSVDGAEIGVDDVIVGVSPRAEPLVVNAGRRRLSAKAAGHTPAQRTVDVASMEETVVSLDLPTIAVAPPKVEGPPPRRAPPVAAWAALGGTAACTIAAGVTGGLAISAHNGLEAALNTFPGDPKTITAAQSKTRTFAVATDVLGGVAIAGAVTTVVLFVVVPRLGEKTTVGLSPTGVVLRTVF
jgi:hypothetical protein